jgi:hypothetical protein
VRLISQFMNRKNIIKNGYLPNIFIIVPGVMIKFTDFIYITECPQVADRRCLLGEGELSDYDTQSGPKGVSCVESVTLLACMLDSPSIYFEKEYAKWLAHCSTARCIRLNVSVACNQSMVVSPFTPVYSTKKTSRYNCILLKVRLTTNDT